MNLPPILPVSSPFFRDIHHGQIQHFQKTVIRRKYRFRFSDLSELTIKSFGGIGSIDQTPNRFRILEIR